MQTAKTSFNFISDDRTSTCIEGTFFDWYLWTENNRKTIKSIEISVDSLCLFQIKKKFIELWDLGQYDQDSPHTQDDM